MSIYSYPVTDKFQARAVTQPNFEPDLFEDDLYVNFDEVRGDEFRKDVFFTLDVDANTNKLLDTTDDYVKIICSGHRGCGKTTELKRLHHDLNGPDRYFSIFLSIEEEMEYSGFQPVDLFVWIILKLVKAIDEHDLPAGQTAFDALAKQLLSNAAIDQELKSTFQTDLGIDAGGGFNFFGLLKLTGIAKSVFASTNVTSTKIREEVRKNTIDIIHQINSALVAVRDAVRQKELGGDLLFVIDGSEKLKFDVYEFLFVQNPNLLRALSVNMIMAIPINSFFQIDAASNNDFPNQYLLPMIKLAEPDSQANQCFKQVIERRLQAVSFFDEGVLDECVQRSGGCMRQLLIIVNKVIVKARGERATLSQTQTVIRELGSSMYNMLETRHVTALQQGTDGLHLGNPEVREMLFQLILLKYNGRVKLNPLLDGFITLPA